VDRRAIRHRGSVLAANVRRRLKSPVRGSGSGAVEALRDSWSTYPRDWKRDPKLNLGFDTLGEEWGGPAFADYLVDLMAPYLGPDADVLELGCGGGKFSQRLAPRCRSLMCTDISQTMIEHTRANLLGRGIGGNVSYRVVNGVDFQGVSAASVDFIFSYDVLLHVQIQNAFSYLLDARRVLRDGGVFMLHQINLASEGGMAHFLGQHAGGTWQRAFDDPRRRGHIYFMSEDQMRALANRAGLSTARVVSDHGAFNSVTAGRDLIGLLRKRPSRLEAADPEAVALVKARGGHTVYAVVDGVRLAFGYAGQFERAGFRWNAVREVSEAELVAIPEGGALELWE
jgi:2-polyprenyl-3-methyl-5-hydroxy-6-metoxy-1,4-benzoquinol methylase